MRDYPILHLDKHKIIVGKDMNVIEHERLSNITLETK
jgi:hypothetical protein